METLDWNKKRNCVCGKNLEELPQENWTIDAKNVQRLVHCNCGKTYHVAIFVEKKS